MRELAEKNQAGSISPGELEELDGFIQAGDFLALLQSKARKVLAQQPSGATRRG
jgi:hypothetical protein